MPWSPPSSLKMNPLPLLQNKHRGKDHKNQKKKKIAGTMGVTSTNEQQAIDRAQEVRQFEDSKLGVKGLLDLGLTSLPPLFIHPPDILSSLKPVGPTTTLIPTVDLSSSDSDRRPLVIQEVARAACEFGFFQIVIVCPRSDRCQTSSPTSTCFTPKRPAGGTRSE
ncbi:hypothetical protein NL676_031941 [Syzygium grande]|nr:hypothetical protein NL676_031941 [Syzygium grande]